MELNFEGNNKGNPKFSSIHDIEKSPTHTNKDHLKLTIDIQKSNLLIPVTLKTNLAKTKSKTKHNDTSLIVDYSASDVNELIIQAHSYGLNHSGTSFEETMNRAKLRKYYLRQFAYIQEQSGMNTYTLKFKIKYEKLYIQQLQNSGRKRSFYCFLIGTISLFILFKYDYSKTYFDNNLIILILCFGIVIPSTIIGIIFGLPFISKIYFFDKYREIITLVIFLLTGLTLIIKKALLSEKGALLPLNILLIPLSGILRVRFFRGSFISLSLVISYLIIGLISQNDAPVSIIFQSLNYGMTAIGGMVAHYRQEILMRRNFAIRLPFDGLMDGDDAAKSFETEKYSKHKLMNSFSHTFKNSDVERYFYRYWYLIDGYPYEHPNAGILHQRVFRVLRYAIMGIIINQLILGLQDRKLLYKKIKMKYYYLTLILRYGIIVPCFLSAGLFMYYRSQSFYKKWVNESIYKNIENIKINTDKKIGGNDVTIDISKDKMFSNKLRNCNKPIKRKYIRYHEYVTSAQIYSMIIISIYLSIMGGLLFISMGLASAKSSQRVVYYMGFLNAILYTHRSGFRLRFMNATMTTSIIVVVFIILIGMYRDRKYFSEFFCYSLVVLIFAMLISHEEESLRRKFFILKSVRILEFEVWFQRLLKIQGWIRRKLDKKILLIKESIKTNHDQTSNVDTKIDLIIDTSAQMTRAGELGFYAQILSLILAITSYFI